MRARIEHAHGIYNVMELTAPHSRILALDLGKRRIGLAISDPLGITAQGLPNLERTNKRADLDALERLARDREVGLFLMGNPDQHGRQRRPPIGVGARIRGRAGAAHRRAGEAVG